MVIYIPFMTSSFTEHIIAQIGDLAKMNGKLLHNKTHVIALSKNYDVSVGTKGVLFIPWFYYKFFIVLYSVALISSPPLHH